MSAPLPVPANYFPYGQLEDRPNIVVDGQAQRATVLTLSHWPWNSTPPALMRDTSTDIAFAYLDSPDLHREVPWVSNSHFDEDGLLSMYTVVDPDNALRYRELMIGTSRAGDFGIYSDPQSAKLAFTLGAFADAETSPLPPQAFTGSAAGKTAALYALMLRELPALLADVDAHSRYWASEYAHLQESEAAIASGDVVIDEVPDLDLAIVRIPEAMPARVVKRYLRQWQRSVHPFAVHNVTQCSRLVWQKGASLEFQYRYESWVQLVSRRPALRIELHGLAEQLNALESGGGEWVFEGINEVAPRLHARGSCRSSLSADDFIQRLSDWLRSQPVAWDPYTRPD